jgi:hypothetical protein
MYFKGGWSQFAEEHDLHQGFFMTFDFHIGTSKFDVRIYDGTQCQKEYEAEVHCNIPGLEVIKIETTGVCIAFHA